MGCDWIGDGEVFLNPNPVLRAERSELRVKLRVSVGM